MRSLLAQLGGDVDPRDLKSRLSLSKNPTDLIQRYSTSTVEFKSREIQLVNLLRSVISQASEIQHKLVGKSGEKVHENMRERQRNNLRQFKLCGEPVLSLFLRLLKRLLSVLIEKYVFKVEFEFYEDDDKTSRGQVVFRFSQMMKILKSLLKCVQNLSAKFSDNKWAECRELLLSSKNNNFKFNVDFFNFLN